MTDPGLPLTRRRPVVRFEHGRSYERDDCVATEYALTIYVNDQEMATVVCTPEHLEDLVVGFLASEGVLRSIDQLLDLRISTRLGAARAYTPHTVNFNQQFYNKRYIASCCGKSRQSFYFYNDAHTARRAEDDLVIPPQAVFRAIADLEANSGVFKSTGGVHTASLCTQSGLLLARSDIGRHNALDKLYGHILRHGMSTRGTMVAFSGRLSSEVVLKVAKMGAAVVVAKSAPTSLALDIAEELNLTAVGFVRGDSFNVYTNAWRVALPATADPTPPTPARPE